jgi:hypothetical protein
VSVQKFPMATVLKNNWVLKKFISIFFDPFNKIWTTWWRKVLPIAIKDIGMNLNKLFRSWKIIQTKKKWYCVLIFHSYINRLYTYLLRHSKHVHSSGSKRYFYRDHSQIILIISKNSFKKYFFYVIGKFTTKLTKIL